MKYLILINNAPNYRQTFIEIGNQLRKEGHDVIFALDSRLTDYTYKDYPIKEKCYYFTDYFAINYDIPMKNYQYKYSNLWNMFFSDFERFSIYNLNRNKPKDYYEKCIANLINFFDELLTKEAIEIVLYENVSNSFAFASYVVAKNLGLKYIGFSSSRLPNRIEVQTSPFGNAIYINKTYKEILNSEITISKEMENYVSNYMKSFYTIIPDYMKNNSLDTKVNLTKRYFSFDKIKLLRNYINYMTNENELFYAFQIDNPLKLSFSMIKRNLYRKLKLRYINKFYSTPSDNEDFYLYPLHYHPESSTSVLAPNFVNELFIIENISKNMPFGTKLYVKDHMSAAGYPSIEFYKALSNLPNVKILHYSHNAKDLIKKSLAVITLTSTVGFEALILNKKVFILGDVFYSQHPNCVKISNINLLFEELSNIRIYDDTEVININFLYAYFLNTLEGDMSFYDEVNYEFSKKVVTFLKAFCG